MKKNFLILFIICCLTIMMAALRLLALPAVKAEEADNVIEIADGEILLDTNSDFLNKKDYEPVNLGKKDDSRTISDEYYIPTWNYFWLSPKYMLETDGYNEIGVCTTVAMQMLMGYHNYYSDRRLIPEYDYQNGERFLDSNYGDVSRHPNVTTYNGLGLDGLIEPTIGTQDAFFERLFYLSDEWEIIWKVADAANDFVNMYAKEIQENVEIKYKRFSQSEALSELNAKRPVILGFDKLFELNFHVMVAYGYATVNGEFGYICNFGWGSTYRYVWISESMFGFMITMQVDHTHYFEDTEECITNENGGYRILECSSCHYKDAVDLFDVNQGTNEIAKLNYCSPNERIIVPNKIVEFVKPMVSNEIAIKGIGKNAFADTKVGSVILPTTVTTIGDYAFKNCGNLKYINLDHVKSIGKEAFLNCGFTDITIPENIETLGSKAFSGCKNIKKISYNASIFNDFSASQGFFKDLQSDNEIELVIGGNVDIIPEYFLYKVPLKINLSFENRTESLIIHQSAFAGSGIKKVTCPKTLYFISPSAFEGCNKLEEFDVGAESNLNSIGADAFNGCTKLAKFKVPRSVTYIGERAFYGCSALNDFTFEDGIDLESIYKETFYGAGIKNIKIPDSVIYIGQSAFDSSKLTNIEIPKSVTMIKARAFYNCKSLEYVTFESGIDFKYIETETFASSKVRNIEIPQSVVDIRDGAFDNCVYLLSITFGEDGQLKYIGANAFRNTNLRIVDIPDTVMEIGESAFERSLHLETVTFSRDSKLQSIKDCTFMGCEELAFITIPDSVTRIGAMAFNNTAITSITIPHSVVEIGKLAFGACEQLQSIDYHAENCADFTSDSFVFSKIRNDSAAKVNVVFCNGVNRVPACFMDNAKFRLDVTFEGSNISIGDFAFYNVKFDSIDFRQSTVFVDEIGEAAFYDSNISYFPSISVTKSNAVYIRESAFYATPIENIKFNDGNVSINIGAYAFDYCQNLKSVTFNANPIVLDIGDYAFRQTPITSISLPAYILKVGECAFALCEDLTTITMKSEYSSTFSYIGVGAFACTAITEFTWPAGISTIRDSTFYGCQNLRTININDSYNNNLTAIEDWAFAYTAIENIKIISTIKYIGAHVFEGCDYLSSVRIYGKNDWEISKYPDFEDVQATIPYSELSDNTNAAWYLRAHYMYYWRRKI